MVPSRVVSIAFFGLVQENLSLLSMEIIAYLTSFLLLLHIHSSGKRNAIMFVATVVQLISMETLFFSNKRWHGQALVCNIILLDVIDIYPHCRSCYFLNSCPCLQFSHKLISITCTCCYHANNYIIINFLYYR